MARSGAAARQGGTRMGPRRQAGRAAAAGPPRAVAGAEEAEHLVRTGDA